MSHLQLASCEAPRFAQCFALHLSKLEALNAVFDCFWAAEVLLFALFSRKEILGTLIFDIPAAVKGAAGWLARIG